MSHAATNWAIKQRGLKPATKILLWHLCDRYHPDNGCFPSQKTLASDCEMSERSIREHTNLLTRHGLIMTAMARLPGKKYESLVYYFAFEDDFKQRPPAISADGITAPKPPAESRQYHRQYLPTNSVREPVTEAVNASADFSDEFSKTWQPNEELTRWARSEGFTGHDIREQTKRFQDFYQKKRSPSSASFAWKKWMRDDKAYREKRAAKTDPDKAKHQRQLQRLEREYQEEVQQQAELRKSEREKLERQERARENVARQEAENGGLGGV